MTNYTTDLCEGGVITGSAGYLDRVPYKMVDNIIGDYTVSSFQTLKDANAFLGYQFSTPKVITKYVLTSVNDGPSSSAWNAWTLQGSNNGIDWTEVHDVSESRDWGTLESRTFVFENTTPYLYYKFIPTENQGSSWYHMCELEMMSSIIPIPVSTIYNVKQIVLRGKATEGWIRPTIAQFFTSKDFKEIPGKIVLGYRSLAGGITTANGYANHYHEPDYVFEPGYVDPDPEDPYPGWLSPNTNPPHWIMCDLGNDNEEIVTKITVYCNPTYINYHPKSFTIQGSYDSTVWDILVTVNDMPIPMWGFTPATYSFENVEAYRYFRLYVTDTHLYNERKWASIGEIHLQVPIIGVSELILEPINTYGHYSLDVCNGGIVKTSSIYNEAYWSGDQAFNNDIDEYGWRTCKGWSGPHYLQYDFGEGNEKQIEKISIYSSTYASMSDKVPRDFKFQGANNVVGAWYNLLDTANNVWTFPGELKEFTFNNNNNFRYYRIEVTATNEENSPETLIGEMEMMEGLPNVPAFVEGPVTIPDSYTADVCNNGTAFSDSETNIYWNAEVAFDDNITGSSDWMSAAYGMPHWLGYDFGEGNKKKIEKIVIYSTYSTNSIYTDQAPREFLIQASDDMVIWRTLQTNIEQTWSSYAKSNEYVFNNNHNFRYYRIYITDNNAGPTNMTVSIGQVEMMAGIYE